MLYYTLKWITISFLLILLLHYIYSFLLNVLTVPKTKDLVNIPIQRYNEIMQITQSSHNVPPNTIASNYNHDNKVIDQNEMQHELTKFLNDLKVKNSPHTETATKANPTTTDLPKIENNNSLYVPIGSTPGEGFSLISSLSSYSPY